MSRLESLHFAAGSPVELLRRNGLNICLGTDSLASNTALSLLGEMQHLGKIPLAELLTWAAPNGARALGFPSWARSLRANGQGWRCCPDWITTR